MRFQEFAIVEKKRRKRKPRWAAYGPGPYGGYGYFSGYSGDGGASGGDGGVGEASYEGNIGAMEVFKFMNTASKFEKELLKKLIAQKAYAKAWALVQGVTGTKLQGKEFEVEEGWRDTLAGLALGAGVAMGSPADAKTNVEKVVVSPGQTVYSIAKAFDTTPKVIQQLNKLDKNFTIKPGQEIKVPKLDWTDIPPEKEKKPETKKFVNKKTDSVKTKTLTGKPFEALVTKAARAGGITDPVELAAFLAQVAVETGDFSTIKERGNRKYIERMYDKKYNPEGAKGIGNTKIGDGWRFRGRGFLQITGRYNYTEASKAIGVNLVKNPELLMKPEIAAEASVWYWKWRVRPNVTNFNDTKRITELVQGGRSHLDRRQDAFADFKAFKLAQI